MLHGALVESVHVVETHVIAGRISTYHLSMVNERVDSLTSGCLLFGTARIGWIILHYAIEGRDLSVGRSLGLNENH